MDKIKLVALLDQTVADAAAKLIELTRAELVAMREIEVESKDRATMLEAIDRQIEALDKAGIDGPVAKAEPGTSDPEQPTAADAQIAALTPSGDGNRDDEPVKPDAKPRVKLVKMTRDPEIYTEGPHKADVHPDEVDNYLSAGWTKA